MRIFKRSISKKFVGQLEQEAAKGGWWADVLADPKLIVALRGSYLNVYWRGQSLFLVRDGSPGLTVTTHEKYLIDPKLAGQVPLINGSFNIESLIKRAFVPRYEGPTSLKKMKDAARYFSGTEKTGCHEIAVRNSNIIDVEITFPSKVSLDDGSDDKQGPRVDIASVEPYGDQARGDQARLVFWEAKAFGNGELRAAGNDVPVCHQIEVYRKYLSDHSGAIAEDYTLVAKNLVEIKNMGWARPLSQVITDIGSGQRQLTLGHEPRVGLIIFGFDVGQRDHSGWQEHLKHLEEKISDVRAAGDAKQIRI
jgi:hypothetical protein